MILIKKKYRQKITLGFSPCPNDTFIFDALVNKKINTQNLDFDFFLADVEELNRRAFNSEPDVTKVSFGAYFSLLDNYVLLNSGAAMGNNNGPLLISKKKYSVEDVEKLNIAIPGKNTTANLLLKIAFPNATNKTEMLFSEIEDAVLYGDADAGLIIHENRFTYKSRGLRKIIDLGQYWEDKTNSPVPLGGIIVRRSFPVGLIQKIDMLIKKSVIFAKNNPDSAYDFVSKHAQEMDKEIMYKHIELYVNKYTENIGNEGRKAIKKLYLKTKKPRSADLFEKLFI